MKVFTAEQIRAGDRFTMENEPISSINLMERAAAKCAGWIQNQFDYTTRVYIFCGVGNNGGDGLALARILGELGWNVKAYLVTYSKNLSEDCQANKKRLIYFDETLLKEIHQIADFPSLEKNSVIVDALFGTGLNRPLDGLPKEMVKEINNSGNTVLSIDIPSGLQAEKNAQEHIAVRAAHTLSFESYKLAFLFPETAAFVGNIHLLPIGIHPVYIQQTETLYQLTELNFVHKNVRSRDRFSHKGNYGHALLMAGSYGKTGAAVLATRAALHTGAGLVSSYIPESSYTIMQTTVPEAMCICDTESHFLANVPDEIAGGDALGIGPGIGEREETYRFLKSVLEVSEIPLVIDADALNLIAKHPELFSLLPSGSILTPHPKEFERLFGKTSNAYDRLQLQIEKSKALNLVILLKGHHSSIATPSGKVWFNTTGNAGMATGGSGDVLTGILTSLLAQGYASEIAAILGAWLHGMAGDLALETESLESLSASSIIQNLGGAFKAAIMS